jgi:hypothetical protein
MSPANLIIVFSIVALIEFATYYWRALTSSARVAP